jgi:soluble lytic murein transglycosylase-like protein
MLITLSLCVLWIGRLHAEGPVAPAVVPETVQTTQTISKDAGASSSPEASSAETPPQASQSGRQLGDVAAYRAFAAEEADRAGLPPEVADAVMAVESGYHPEAVGDAGEIGLMQIMPSTARMLGFAGSLSELAVPATNIRLGVIYLAAAWRLAGGDLCTAVMKYRAGHGETRFSYRSVDYCLAVRAKLAAHGYAVTGPVPVATFGEPSAACRRCAARSIVGGVGSVNFVALNAQLSALVAQSRGGH